jgi:NADH:ubiquinone oxidoreductase subunit F (NADH-binding)
MLTTVSGGVARPGVFEVGMGSELGWLLDAAGAGPVAGVLVGGYFGTWLAPGDLDRARMSRSSLGRLGATPGCGVVAVLPSDACPLAETARVARWLAGQSAGQCGPCANGLPAIADALDALVDGDHTGEAHARVVRWSAMVRGRGACKLPDGAVGLVQSALGAFPDHVEGHRVGGRCAGAGAPPVLPLPRSRVPA